MNRADPNPAPGPAVPPVLLAALAPGVGFSLLGEDGGYAGGDAEAAWWVPGDQAGNWVASAGDVNGDGLADLLVGGLNAEPGPNPDPGPDANSGPGAAWLVLGRAAGFPSTLSLADIGAGQGGVVRYGAADGDIAGAAVATAGDFNGDGLADFVVGAPGGDGPGGTRPEAGAAHILFGRREGFATPGKLGADGIVIHGAAAGDRAGAALAPAGDLDADGFADLLVGAYGAGGTGAGYVVFGRPGAGAVDLAEVAAGRGGFALRGEQDGDLAGWSLAAAGDLDGDGLTDLVVGARGAAAPDGARPGAGAAYVVLGRREGFGAGIDLAAIAAGEGGFALHGEDAGDALGVSVAPAGDVDGDGIADLAIGAFRTGAAGNAKPDAGTAYLLFGRRGGFGATPDLPALLAAGAAVAIHGEASADWAGVAVAGAGDVNGDGIDDLLIGAEGAAGAADALPYAGAGYVLFGRAGGFAGTIDLGEVAAGRGGFALLGAEADAFAGWSIAPAGDMDGDGFADIAIGAPFTDAFGRTDAGAAHVVLGRDFSAAVTHAGGATADPLRGSAGGDAMVGGAGNDTLDGAGGADALTGGAGDDVLLIGDGAFRRADGGGGFDTLRLAPGPWRLDLAALGARRLLEIEAIDLTAPGPAILRLGAAEIVALGGARLRILGAADDLVVLTDPGWAELAVAGGVRTLAKVGLRLLLDADVALAQGQVRAGGAGAETMRGGILPDRLDGGAGDDTLLGWSGADTLSGGAGADRLWGGPGDDLIHAMRGDIVIEAPSAGADTVIATGGPAFTLAVHLEALVLGGAEVIAGIGNAADNRIEGQDADNVLRGRAGDDTLEGGDGADILIGGAGRDRLAGGAGADRFRFDDASDSDAAAPDGIIDFAFADGDRIDLRRIDADALAPGDQRFAWRGDSDFSGASGEWRAAAGGAPGLWRAEGDVDGDGAADVALLITSGTAPLGAWFLL